MGRIDEALRRAAGGKGGNLTPPAPTTNPATEVFTSPWEFNDDAAQPARDASPAEAALLLTPTLPNAGSRPTAGGNLSVFRGFHQSAIGRIVAAPGAPAGLSEQFRRLAALLHHAQLVQGTKIILITSANPGDGKTLTAANLALTLSESYRRQVLLIDADLRRPSLHELFDVPNVNGLNDGLKASRESKLAVLQISEMLTLLPAGRPDPDPMSSLTSERMREVLAESAVRFDWVIVDTPPLGLLTDASLLSTMVDGALVVVRANRTPYADVVRTVDAIGRGRLLGVVLNAMDAQSPDRAYDRYYGGDALTAPTRED